MLSTESRALVGDGLDMGDGHRQAPARVLDPPARVRQEAAIEIIGAAAIEGVVGAPKKVDDPGRKLCRSLTH